MGGWYQRGFELLPSFLKRRIFPLRYEVEEFAVSSAVNRPGILVLDAGAGEGLLRDRFEDCLYVSVDLAEGDGEWDYSGLDIIGNLNAVPAAEAVADVVLNFQVLEHVPDPGAVIKEFFRVLKPGGSLYLTAPQGWHEHQQPHDYFRFTRYSLAVMLEAAGFRQIEIAPMGGYFIFLGMWTSFIPKIVFLPLPRTLRVILFPLELVSLGIFSFLTPLACYYLDRLDLKKEFTLCYRCRAVKPLA